MHHKVVLAYHRNILVRSFASARGLSCAYYVISVTAFLKMSATRAFTVLEPLCRLQLKLLSALGHPF
jgi:hypothetical protein